MKQERIRELLDECCCAFAGRRAEILEELALHATVIQNFEGTTGYWAPSTEIGGPWSMFEYLFEAAVAENSQDLSSLFLVAAALCGDREPGQRFAKVEWELL